MRRSSRRHARHCRRLPESIVAMDRDHSRRLITSSNNSHMKLMRSLSRRKVRRAERAFLLEGRRLVEDAIHEGMDVRTVLVRDDVDPSHASDFRGRGIDVFAVSAEVFDQSSSVEHSQGFAAICEMPGPPAPRVPVEGDLLVLDQLCDPGNMGTALRSAAASGITTVLVMPSSVDPFAPKVVRAGMGAHFRLSIGEYNAGWNTALRSDSPRVVFADMNGDQDYDAFNWGDSFVLVLGGETQGFSRELSDLKRTSVRIPMAGNVESLNAAVAGSILMFEAARQRRAEASQR